MADPTANPSGPFGQAAQDQREWDAMKAKQGGAYIDSAEHAARSNMDQGKQLSPDDVTRFMRQKNNNNP